MKLRKWIAVLAALGVAVGLTACGGKTDAPAESKPQILVPDSKPVGDEQLGQPSQTDPFQGMDIFDDKVEIHRLVEQIDFSADGIPHTRTVFSYDDAGHLINKSVDMGETTEIWNEELYIFEYVYGPYNGTVNAVRTWQYDDQGLLIARAYKVQFEGETSVSSREEFDYAYTFGRNGEIDECTSAGRDGYNQNLYKFTYEDGRITNVKAYAANGKLFQEQTYSYDVWGRLEKETFSEIEGDFSYTYSYDNAGRCVEVCNRWGTVYTVDYDEDGNMISNPMNYGSDEGINYTYDDHGNVIAVDYADGSRSEYTYETCKVTREEKECLERQLRMINADESWHRNPDRTFYYHLIPNPVW